MAQSAPAFEFGPAGMVEPMLQAFSNNPFLTQSFGPQMFSPDAMPAFPGFGGETLSFDPMGWTDPGRGRAPETPFETWLSLFPSAPMFGVQWAFWPMIASFVPNPQGMFGMGEFGLGEPGDSAAGAGEMPKTTRQSAPETSRAETSRAETSRAEREREALSMPGGVRAPDPAPRSTTIADQPARDPSSVVVPLPKRNTDNGSAAMPARAVSAETRKAPLKTPAAKSEAAKLSAPATKPATAKAPVAKTPVAKTPAAKAPAAKAPAAKPAATKAAATKSVAAKAPKAKGTTAKTPTAKASTAKATTTKATATKAPAGKAKPAKAAKPAATPAKKKRGADGRPGNLLSKAPAKVDDLKKIKGVGEKLEMVLNDLGIYQYKQIAAFDVEDYAWLDGRLGAFKGRGVRDDWSAQAKALLKK